MPYDNPVMLLLSRKRDLVNQLSRIVNDSEVTEPGTAVTIRLTEFVGAHEQIIGKIKSLNKELEELKEMRRASGEYKDFEHRENEMEEQIAILELDANAKTLELMERLQKEIKEFNNRL